MKVPALRWAGWSVEGVRVCGREGQHQGLTQVSVRLTMYLGAAAEADAEAGAVQPELGS